MVAKYGPRVCEALQCMSIVSATPTFSTWEKHPWHRLHEDFAGPFLGNMYLLVDAYSRWLGMCHEFHYHCKYSREAAS